MTLNIVGINHRTADVQMRGRVAFVNSELPNALVDAYQHHGLDELVILSTCNRTELISSSNNADALLAWFSKNRKVPDKLLHKYCYAFSEKDAIKHLIKVASGMDAMMFGESEIFGQVKTAYRIAQDCGAVGNTLRHVFEQVFRITKMVRTQTGVNQNPTSVQASVVHLIERSVPHPNRANIVLIGVSEMIALILARLVDRNVHNVRILNRTYSSARALAERFNVEAAPLKDMERYIGGADVVVSCTGSSGIVVELPLIKRTVAKHDKRPLLLIDLAVPRDIDHHASQLPHVQYHDIDDLQKIINQSQLTRKRAASDAHALIDAQLVQYQSPLHAADLSNSIREYQERAHALRDQETSKFLAQIESGKSPEQTLRDLAHSLTRKLVHLSAATVRRNTTDSPGKPD